MSPLTGTIPDDEPTRARVRNALKLVCASLPHLAGLAHSVQILPDRRVPTAAISRAGRLYVNPEWFASLDHTEAAFVAAHELLHLCLETHQRGEGTDGEVFNWAHDYVINDMLVHELGCPVPSNGLVHEGARLLSAEKIVGMIRRGLIPGPKPARKSVMTQALEDAGVMSPMPADLGPGTGDVLSREMERRLSPDTDSAQEDRLRRQIKTQAAKAVSLGLLKERLANLPETPEVPLHGMGRGVALTEALRTAYRPPWELALQQWMEAMAPGPRTYARPSRRGADRSDAVLPGRSRVGWALHVVLDTSGSMVDLLPRVLGVIGTFCDSVGVAAVHVLQCDEEVTRDEWIEPERLASYPIAGFGGSNMTPALARLADDPEVEAVVVLTDGDIEYPSGAMPYNVLWAITADWAPDWFRPSYGHVLCMPGLSESPSDDV